MNNSVPYHSIEATTRIPLEFMSPVQRIIFIVFMSIMSICGTMFNLLVIIVYRQKHNENASLYLLFTLSVIDFLVSLFVIPTTLLEYFQFFHNISVFCKFSYFLRYTTTAISVALLGLIAFERYYTITSRKVNSSRKTQMNLVKQSRIGVIMTLVVCTLYGSVCFFLSGTECDTLEHEQEGEEHNELHRIYNYTTVSILMLILACVTFLYVRTYIVVKKSSNKVFSCNTKAFDNQRANVKNLILEVNKQSFVDFNNQDENNKVLVSTVDHLSSIFKDNQLNKTNFQNEESTDIIETKKKVYFNTEKQIYSPSNIDEPNESVSYLSNLGTFPQYNESPNNKERTDIQSIKMKKIYSKVNFISNENPEKLQLHKIKIVPLENDEKLNDCKSIVLNKTVTNNSIRKDWKVAKIFALVNF